MQCQINLYFVLIKIKAHLVTLKVESSQGIKIGWYVTTQDTDLLYKNVLEVGNVNSIDQLESTTSSDPEAGEEMGTKKERDGLAFFLFFFL